MKHDHNIDTDSLEEIKEILENAIEYRRWVGVEDAIELLNELLGVESDTDDDEENE